MKNLTKFLIVLTAVAMLASDSFAQIIRAKAGLNLSTILEKDDEDTYSTDYKMKPGFHVGGTVEFPLGKMFSLEPGLLLTTKGYKYSESGTEYGYTYDGTESANTFNIDIPIAARVSFDLKTLKIFAIAGPYLGFGLSGKYKWDYEFNGQTESGDEAIKWGSGTEDHLKRLDYGLILGAGVDIKAFEVGVNYSLGLANISADTEGGYQISNRVLGITLGYRFGGE